MVLGILSASLSLQITWSSVPLTLPLHYLPATSHPGFLGSVQDGIVCNHYIGLCGLPPGQQSSVILDQSYTDSCRWLARRCTQKITCIINNANSGVYWEIWNDLIWVCTLEEVAGYTESNIIMTKWCYSNVQFVTCRQGSIVDNRTPGTRHLVHMETHNKLIVGVWIQILNHQALFGTVNKQHSYMMGI